MPKKKSTSKNTKQKLPPAKELFNKLKNFIRKHRIVSIIVLVATIGVLIWAGQIIVIRYQFYQVGKSLQSVAQSIANTANVPISGPDKTCHYSSEIYTKGILTCSVEFRLSVDGDNLDSINSTMKQFDSLFISNRNINNFSTQYRTKEIFKDSDLNDPYKAIDTSFKVKYSDFHCFAVYSVTEDSKYKLKVDLGCAKDSPIEYFSVEK
jgi:hypothetical protein